MAMNFLKTIFAASIGMAKSSDEQAADPQEHLDQTVYPILDMLRMFARNPPAMAGSLILLLIIGATLLGPVLYTVDPHNMVNMPFAPPGAESPLGTDYLGRDILAGILAGGRTTLMVGVIAALITAVLGVLIGSCAGFFGGLTDTILMKVTEFFQVMPPLLFAMVIVAIFEPNIWIIVLAIGLVSWTSLARLARAEFLKARELDYVKAARSNGARSTYLIFRVILPNAMPPLVVAAALAIGMAILFEGALSFLGLGDPNTMSWGMIIGQNRDYLFDAWWTVTFPGTALFLAVLAISLVGDGINDALNPKLRRR